MRGGRGRGGDAPGFDPKGVPRRVTSGGESDAANIPSEAKAGPFRCPAAPETRSSRARSRGPKSIQTKDISEDERGLESPTAGSGRQGVILPGEEPAESFDAVREQALATATGSRSPSPAPCSSSGWPSRSWKLLRSPGRGRGLDLRDGRRRRRPGRGRRPGHGQLIEGDVDCLCPASGRHDPMAAPSFLQSLAPGIDPPHRPRRSGLCRRRVRSEGRDLEAVPQARACSKASWRPRRRQGAARPDRRPRLGRQPAPAPGERCRRGPTRRRSRRRRVAQRLPRRRRRGAGAKLGSCRRAVVGPRTSARVIAST